MARKWRWLVAIPLALAMACGYAEDTPRKGNFPRVDLTSKLEGVRTPLVGFLTEEGRKEYGRSPSVSDSEVVYINLVKGSIRPAGLVIKDIKDKTKKAEYPNLYGNVRNPILHEGSVLFIQDDRIIRTKDGKNLETIAEGFGEITFDEKGNDYRVKIGDETGSIYVNEKQIQGSHGVNLSASEGRILCASNRQEDGQDIGFQIYSYTRDKDGNWQQKRITNTKGIEYSAPVFITGGEYKGKFIARETKEGRQDYVLMDLEGKKLGDITTDGFPKERAAVSKEGRAFISYGTPNGWIIAEYDVNASVKWNNRQK